MPDQNCAHIESITTIKAPHRRQCDECVKTGATWVHLRTCQSCGDRNAAGAHRSYRGAGIVLRCPHCGDIALRLAVLADQYVFELRGAWSRRSEI